MNAEDVRDRHTDLEPEGDLHQPTGRAPSGFRPAARCFCRTPARTKRGSARSPPRSARRPPAPPPARTRQEPSFSCCHFLDSPLGERRSFRGSCRPLAAGALPGFSDRGSEGFSRPFGALQMCRLRRRFSICRAAPGGAFTGIAAFQAARITSAFRRAPRVPFRRTKRNQKSA